MNGCLKFTFIISETTAKNLLGSLSGLLEVSLLSTSLCTAFGRQYLSLVRSDFHSRGLPRIGSCDYTFGLRQKLH